MTTAAFTLLASNRRPFLLNRGGVPAAILRSRRGPRTVLFLSGEFDIVTAGMIGEAVAVLLLRRRSTSMTVDLDLHAVTFMDSRGLSALAAGVRTLLDAGHQVSLSRPARPLRKLLSIAYADGWLPAELPVACAAPATGVAIGGAR